METKVVNLHLENYDVYIGRAGHGQSGYYGNPFRSGNRVQDIEDFKKYFYHRLKTDSEFKNSVLQLRGKVLGCFCHPSRCHGHVIADYLNSSTKPIKMAIIGSRTFDNYNLMKESLCCFDISMVISGAAQGADLLARRFANENNIALKEFLPDWDKFGKSAGFRRNRQIIEHCDECIAFWDGESRGTKNSIDVAYELQKPVHIVKFTVVPWVNFWDDEFSVLG